MNGARCFQLIGILTIALLSSTWPALAGQRTKTASQERQPAAGSERTIVAQVDNYAEISPTKLADAEHEAARIYEAIGVRMIWVHGEVELSDPSGLPVRVLLLSRDMAARKIKMDGVADSVLGQASRLSGRAYVFTHRVAELAFRHDHAFGWVLGQAIAHEIGHLVLPNDSHSDRGIMSATFFVRSKTYQHFTNEQSAAIRSRVMAHSAVAR